MTPSIYIKAVLKIKAQKELYRDINETIASAQHDRDFPTRVQPIDSYLECAFVDVLDDALFSLTGFKELASYHLYECDVSGYIKDTDGQEYKWASGEEFEAVVFEMIKTKK